MGSSVYFSTVQKVLCLLQKKKKEKMVRRSTRSRSRGRPDRYQAGEAPAAEEQPKTKVTKKKAEEKKEKKMASDEDEYDVEYENGTVYTIRAKDVYKASSKIMKKAGSRRSKSRSRARSQAKEKKPKADVSSEAD